MPAKRPRGRPRTFDEARRQTLCMLISIGLSRNEACRHVGVKPSSVVHAARTDAEFAKLLNRALIDRDNRSAEFADFGSRSWRAYARRLEARSPYFRLNRAKPKHLLDDPRFHRAIRRIVSKLLKNRFAKMTASSPNHAADDYCSENPPLLRAPADTKTIIAAPTPFLFQNPPMISANCQKQK